MVDRSAIRLRPVMDKVAPKQDILPTAAAAQIGFLVFSVMGITERPVSHPAARLAAKRERNRKKPFELTFLVLSYLLQVAGEPVLGLG